MKKRKITVMSATVLLAIVAFPSLSTAAGAPVLYIDSILLGDSGCQMNVQLNPDQTMAAAVVAPAYTPPAPPPPPPECSADCFYDNSVGQDSYYCPLVPPTDNCFNPTWKCTWSVDFLAEVCWWEAGPVELGYMCTEAVLTLPTVCSPSPPGGIIIQAATLSDPTASATTSSCTDIPDPVIAEPGSTLICTCPSGTTCDPDTGTGFICETRLSVDQNVMEGLSGSCVYRYTSKTGTTSTVTLQCNTTGCACGTSGCPSGSPTAVAGVYCP